MNDVYARWNPEQRGELKQMGHVVGGDILLPPSTSSELEVNGEG